MLSKGRSYIRALLCLLISLAVFATGCSTVAAVIEDSVFTVGDRHCALSDAKIILINFQKEYASPYGINMWDHDYGDEESLEDYIKDLAIAQLAQVYTLDVIADEQEISLTEDEQETAALAAEYFYAGLSDDEISYLGIEESDAADLFEKYMLARKVYVSVMDSVDSEVSDSEARVMTAMRIVLSDSDDAEEAYALVSAEGSDFESAASSLSESSKITVEIDSSTYSEEITDVLFDLKEGEISQVLSDENGYYIFCCISPIDEELTDANKEVILEQRREEAIAQVYGSYASSLSSSLDEEKWAGISVDPSLELDGSSFLEIYDTYCKGQE